MLNNKEIAVIGLGPAGVSASIYLKRYGLTPICYEKEIIGGKTNYTDKIVNLAGFVKEKGQLLASDYEKQLESFKIDVIYKTINKVSKIDDHFLISSNNYQKEFDYVILAMGLQMKKSNIKNIDPFMGKGVSSCAVCDGNFYKNKIVAVYGNGNECLVETSYLASLAKQVYLIYKENDLKGIESEIERIKNSSNITLLSNTIVSEIVGKNKITGINIFSNNKASLLNIDGLFIYGQMLPSSSILDFDVEKDDKGFIISDANMETSVSNLYAVGDFRNTSLRQIAVATSDGAIAASNIHLKVLNS